MDKNLVDTYGQQYTNTDGQYYVFNGAAGIMKSINTEINAKFNNDQIENIRHGMCGIDIVEASDFATDNQQYLFVCGTGIKIYLQDKSTAQQVYLEFQNKLQQQYPVFLDAVRYYIRNMGDSKIMLYRIGAKI